MGQNKKSFGKVVFTIPEKGRIIKWRKLVEKRNVYFFLQRRRKREGKGENIWRENIMEKEKLLRTGRVEIEGFIRGPCEPKNEKRRTIFGKGK